MFTCIPFSGNSTVKGSFTHIPQISLLSFLLSCLEYTIISSFIPASFYWCFSWRLECISEYPEDFQLSKCRFHVNILELLAVHQVLLFHSCSVGSSSYGAFGQHCSYLVHHLARRYQIYIPVVVFFNSGAPFLSLCTRYSSWLIFPVLWILLSLFIIIQIEWSLNPQVFWWLYSCLRYSARSCIFHPFKQKTFIFLTSGSFSLEMVEPLHLDLPTYTSPPQPNIHHLHHFVSSSLGGSALVFSPETSTIVITCVPPSIFFYFLCQPQWDIIHYTVHTF